MMDFQPIQRAPQAFQQGVPVEVVEAIGRRVFGPGARVVAAVELGSGMYNSTYRLLVAGRDRPVILRIAPEPGRQFRSEEALLRNEYASVPYLAPIASLMPQTVAADWSHEIVARDWVVQTHLDGIPAPERLGDYPRAAWPAFFGQMGAIVSSVQAVRGPHFGPVGGRGYATWSEAVLASLEDIAADLDSVGLDADDVRQVAAAASERCDVLDEITVPRMSLGDFWTLNTMLHPSASEPTITGVFDTDRTWWADPASGWAIRMALAKQDERRAFWESYGPLDLSPGARWRQRVYEARHLGAVRLERQRLGQTDVADTYEAMSKVLADVPDPSVRVRWRWQR